MWEYWHVIIMNPSYSIGDAKRYGDYFLYRPEIKKTLDQASRNGWELVSTKSIHDNTELFFKRPKK